MTLDELEQQLITTPGTEFKTLLNVLRVTTTAVDVNVIMRFGVYDWLRSIGHCDSNEALRLLMVFEKELTAAGDLWKVTEGNGVGIVLNILDRLFFTFNVWAPGKAPMQSRFYAIDQDKFIDRLPYHTLTGLSCNLSVLLTRLSSRIVKARTAQSAVTTVKAEINRSAGDL